MSKQVIAYDDELSMRNQLTNVFRALRNEYDLILTFPNAVDVLTHIKQYKPDIIFLDIEMRENDEDGLMALYQIKNKYPNQIVMMLTTFDNDDKIFNAICLGADGYMLKSDFIKNMPIEVMRRSLSIIFSDGAYLTPAVAKKILHLFRDATISVKVQKIVDKFKKLISQPKKMQGNDMEYQLKDIQIQILEDIVAGKKSSEIALERDMPENTVNHHIKGIYRELEVHSRAQAVRKAIEESIVKIKK